MSGGIQKYRQTIIAWACTHKGPRLLSGSPRSPELWGRKTGNASPQLQHTAYVPRCCWAKVVENSSRGPPSNLIEAGIPLLTSPAKKWANNQSHNSGSLQRVYDCVPLLLLTPCTSARLLSSQPAYNNTYRSKLFRPKSQSKVHRARETEHPLLLKKKLRQKHDHRSRSYTALFANHRRKKVTDRAAKGGILVKQKKIATTTAHLFPPEEARKAAAVALHATHSHHTVCWYVGRPSARRCQLFPLALRESLLELAGSSSRTAQQSGRRRG